MAEKPEESATQYRLIGPSDGGEVSDLLADLGAREAKYRLQALIAEWLRMENLVVLAGAGTSVSSGGKIMGDLEREVLETVKNTKVFPGKAARSRIVRFIEHRQEDAPAQGFEEWLSLLVNVGHLTTMSGSPFRAITWKGLVSPKPEDVAWLVDRIGKAIFAECALSLDSATVGNSAALEAPPHLAFLAKLVARDSNLGRAHLFTLNYDTLFEQALEILGIQYFDGFTGRADARFDPSVYGLDIYYPGEVAEGRVRRLDKFVQLYKLHGSIHWLMRANELRARHPDLSPFMGYGELSPAAKAEKLNALSAALPAVGILPTANKFSQTLSMPFAHLFRSLQIRLGAPQTFLLVLGYGFGDAHVTRIIETALMNPSLVLLVVEPDPTSATVERVRQYRDLGKRAFVLTPTDLAFGASGFKFATFDDFARCVMPDVQWLDDFLRLRRVEKQMSAARGPEAQDGEM